jgi:hypothetical protein
LNSTIVAGSVTLMALALGSLAGYALGRFNFRGRSAALYLMLSMTIFPQIAILGALYKMINTFGIYDRLGALIITYMIFTLPFTVWVLTSFTRGLPRDLEEAAYIDGATCSPSLPRGTSSFTHSRSSRPSTSAPFPWRSRVSRGDREARSRFPGARSWPRRSSSRFH